MGSMRITANPASTDATAQLTDAEPVRRDAEQQRALLVARGRPGGQPEAGEAEHGGEQRGGDDRQAGEQQAVLA